MLPLWEKRIGKQHGKLQCRMEFRGFRTNGSPVAKHLNDVKSYARVCFSNSLLVLITAVCQICQKIFGLFQDLKAVPNHPRPLTKLNQQNRAWRRISNVCLTQRGKSTASAASATYKNSIPSVHARLHSNVIECDYVTTVPQPTRPNACSEHGFQSVGTK